MNLPEEGKTANEKKTEEEYITPTSERKNVMYNNTKLIHMYELVVSRVDGEIDDVVDK